MTQAPREGPAPDAAGAALDLVRRLSAEDFGPDAASIAPGGAITPPP
jgi:hypothetical protein